MTSAIFEILGLLTVSCLIGFYFTRRYWLGVLASHMLESRELQRLHEEARNLAGQRKEEIEELKEQLNSLTKEAKKSQSKKAVKTDTEDGALIDDLKLEVERLIEQMNEKERELEIVSKELETRKISYYKQIDGKRYKAITLLKAEQSVSGKGDGRISIEDAKEIFDTISDGHAYTQVEKDTMHYIREHYKWTEGADALFRKKVRSWAAKHHQLD